MTTALFETPRSFVRTPHGDLAYYKFGAGPDVVLVHGWPLSAATFRGLVPTLAERFTLHLFDMPGTGHSAWRGPNDLASNAGTLRAAIDALGLGPYAFVAHDSGASIARLVAAEDARVRAIVMGNTEIPGHRSRLVEAYCLAAKVPGMATLLRAVMRSRTIRRSAVGFGGCFTDPGFVDGEFGDLFVRPMLASPRVAEGHITYARNFDWRLIDRLDEVHGAITAKVLCVWGTDDPFFPLVEARRMLGQFPAGAELVEIPGAKLFVHEDHAEAFAGHAVRFLS